MRALKKRWARLTHWEYWPFDLIYFPVKIYFVWLAIKNRSFFFFTSANPSIDFGGMLGESKFEIFGLIPDEYLPRMALISPNDWDAGRKAGESIGYPLIAKPDIGERGNLVEKIESEVALKGYMFSCQVPFLIQEFVDYPVELGVFYACDPDTKKGKITSIVQKEFLSGVGDGKSTVKELLMQITRANLQIDFDHPRFQKKMKMTPKVGEKVVVEGIGNHCRGTIFLNRNSEIDERLNSAIHELSQQIDGFYFGRYDLRCASFNDLRDLKHFKILELNGAGAEPGHIYQPGASLLSGYKSLFWHFGELSRISAINRRKGIAHWSFKRGMAKLNEIKAYNQLAKNL